jgi:Tfp pilus assembly protein PilV
MRTQVISRKNSHPRGFSLVEAVVALALCGIIAIPMYKWFVGSKWNTLPEYKYIAHRILEDALHQTYIENYTLSPDESKNIQYQETHHCGIPCTVSIHTKQTVTQEGFILTEYIGNVHSQSGLKLSSLRLPHFGSSSFTKERP